MGRRQVNREFMVTIDKAIPESEWLAFLAVYDRRADLEVHRRAVLMAAELAERYPESRAMQVFCARTAYYCAHRLKDSRAKAGMAALGVEAAARVLAADPADYDGRYWRGMNSFKARESEGLTAALREARQVKELLTDMIAAHPDRFEAYMILGALYRELPPLVSFGDKKKALRLLEKGAALAPNDPEMLLELAAGYRKVGRKGEAKVTYRRVIDECPAAPFAEWETEDARQYARKKLKKLGFLSFG